MSRSTAERFSVTYAVVNRLWCNGCAKAETLPDLSDATVSKLEAEHQCGPRASMWNSPGLA